MTPTRIRVHGVFDGRTAAPIVVRPDTTTPGRIFYRGPVLATLTRGQALELATALADLIESDAAGRFVLRGRQADLLEIAGKRASLGELTRHLLAIPGVEDGVVLQLDEADALGVSRIAAAAVAPDLDEGRILDALRRAVDPVFLPRRLRLVSALPRNETGKLPRAALLQLLAGAGR